MSEITARIDDLLQKSNLKRADLVRATGIPESTIRQWIVRGSIPSAEAAYKVAQYFHVTVEYLLTGNDNCEFFEKNVLEDEELYLIEMFRHLDERDKNAVLSMCEVLKKQYAESEKSQSASG